MLPFRPHAVVFDMDGLLIESEVLYRDSFLAASAEGGHGMQVETYQKVCGSPWDVITGTIFADYGADFPIDAFRDAWLRHLGVMMAEGVALKPGVAEILDLLDRLDIRRAIATSSQHTSVTRHLGPYDLLRRFDTIVARGDYTEPKPAPMPYLCRKAPRPRSWPLPCTGRFLFRRPLGLFGWHDDNHGTGCRAADRGNAGEVRCRHG